MAVTPNSIITPQTIKTGTALVTAANTTYTTTPTNTVKLITAGANGSRVTKIAGTPLQTVTATQLQLFRSKNGGTTKQFFKSKLLPAYTMSATTEATSVDFGFSDAVPLLLEAGEEIYAASGAGFTPGVLFDAEWGDY